MVVRRGGGHHLRDPQRLDLVRGRVRPLDRVGERAAGDDRPLAGHQSRHRGDGAEPAGVGERDVGALEVVRRELVLAGLGDQVLVGGVEGGEVERPRGLHAGHHQAARAVLALDVDRDPEVDVAGLDHVRLAVDLGVRAPHHRPLAGRLDDRPGDQVRERDLHAALLECPVDRLALGVERVDGQRPERGRGRHRPALVHRLGEHRRGAPQRLGLALHGRRGGGSRAVAVGRSEHVLLGHLAARARALDGGDVDPLRRRHAAGHRGGAAVVWNN